MKNLIFIIAIIVFVGCKEETPTENNLNLNKEYTLEELENDTNWVEVIDIDTVEGPCIHIMLFYQGGIIRNETDFDSLKTESIQKYGELNGLDLCVNDFKDYNIDTNKNMLLLYYTKTNKYPKTTRKVFKHKVQNSLIYYNKLERTDGNEGVNIYYDRIIVPRTNEVKFITINEAF